MPARGVSDEPANGRSTHPAPAHSPARRPGRWVPRQEPQPALRLSQGSRPAPTGDSVISRLLIAPCYRTCSRIRRLKFLHAHARIVTGHERYDDHPVSLPLGDGRRAAHSIDANPIARVAVYLDSGLSQIPATYASRARGARSQPRNRFGAIRCAFESCRAHCFREFQCQWKGRRVR